LRHAPGLRILAPGSRRELKDMLRWAVNEQAGPVAIRYPRGGEKGTNDAAWNGVRGLVSCRCGETATILVYGNMADNAVNAAELLEKQGISVSVLRLMLLEPLPVQEIIEHTAGSLFVVEELDGYCGICDCLSRAVHQQGAGIRVYGINLGHQYVQHGAVNHLHAHYGIDGAHIAERVQEVLSHEN